MQPTLLLAALFSLSAALYTPKGSSCTIECGTKASNFTGVGDLVCQDTAYNDNSKGVLFKQCLSCLSNSTYVNDASSFNGNSDQYWYLWHLKYVQQYCLIDTPQTAAAKNCASQCTPMKAPLDTSWIYNKAGVQPQYGFCGWNSSTYMTYANQCASCLQGQEGGVIIGNFADTTYNACKSQPQAADGELITVSRDLFDSAIVGSSATTATGSTVSTSTPSDPSTDTSMSASSTTSSSTSDASTAASAVATSAAMTSATIATTSATASSVQSDLSSQSKSSGLSSPAAAGIGVGATLLVLAFAAGIFLIVQRRKRVPTLERLTTPPSYAHELGNTNMQVNEIGGGEKNWHKMSAHETGGLPLQELDATGRR